MRFEWTPAVARAFEAAQAWAAHLGAAELDPDHLLHGLLAEEEGRAAALFLDAGLDPGSVRLAFAERTPIAPAQASGSPLPLSVRAQTILDRARDLAHEISVDRAVPSEALLLALLRQEETLRGFLESLGLAFARLEAAILAVQPPPLVLEEPLQLTDPAEQVDSARILDANANRAREALRVLEDYCRFALDDAFLSSELKRLRHDLAEILDHLDPEHRWLAARETLRDVGTSLSTAREQQRHSLPAVAQANLKRLQEALRSLEEFGKLQGAEVGRALEGLRYRSYTLEKALLLGSSARHRLDEARLMVLLTGARCAAALDWTIQEAAAGGADIFQLREKDLEDRALLERAHQVRRWTRAAGVLFVVNDRPDIARLVEADGVHLGQDDLSVKDARRILGPEALVGVSTHNLEQVRQAVLDGASYLGVGPVFPSGTKDFAEFPGLEFVRQATAETSLPLFAIGGVSAGTIQALAQAGARRVAVSQAICQADDPRQMAAELRRHLT